MKENLNSIDLKIFKLINEVFSHRTGCLNFWANKIGLKVDEMTGYWMLQGKLGVAGLESTKRGHINITLQETPQHISKSKITSK